MSQVRFRLPEGTPALPDIIPPLEPLYQVSSQLRVSPESIYFTLNPQTLGRNPERLDSKL
eukprot:1104161-Rhodomonas_salina.3